VQTEASQSWPHETSPSQRIECSPSVAYVTVPIFLGYLAPFPLSVGHDGTTFGR
jgi:hypothetical protein